MAILRVNVRPASRPRRLVNSQWGETAKDFSQIPLSRTEPPSVSPPDVPSPDLTEQKLSITENSHAQPHNALSKSSQLPASPKRDTVTNGTVPNYTVPSTVSSSDAVSPPALPNRATLGTSDVVVPSVQTTDYGTDLEPSGQEENEMGWLHINWSLTPSTTVGRALIAATQRLQAGENETPQLDAQVILAHVLGKDRSWLFAHHDYKLSSDEAQRYTDLIVRRINHEPVAYLIGRREFYGLDFHVDQRVLIPRPETELLVDAVLGQIEMRTEELAPGYRLRVLDVGTGCGAIALAVAANSPDVDVYATDVSADAIEVARLNIRRLDARCQVTLLHGDLLIPFLHKVDAHQVDFIAANLPYIDSQEYKSLAPDVREYEPQLALEAGPRGLDAISRLLEQAPQHLRPGGVIFLEIGADQGHSVMSLASTKIPQAQLISLRQDYNGRDRLIIIAL